MKTIEIWMEGYAATGQRSGAQKIGEYEAIDFNDAIKQYMKEYPKHGIEKNVIKRRKSNWNIWACNLYDNEIDARKGFG